MVRRLLVAALLLWPVAAAAQPVAFGGNGVDSLRDVAIDASGTRYLTGGTSSSDLFTTTGQLPGGSFDGFFRVTDASGALVCSARWGGPAYERFYAVALGPDGTAYTAGRAGASAPVTQGAAFGGDQTPVGAYGQQDGVIVAWSASCAVQWAMYVGGSGREFIRDIQAHASGLYVGVSDVTRSLPWASGVLSGPTDGVLASVSLDGQTIRWAFYEGGSSTATDDGLVPSLAVSDSGIAAAFITSSTDLATTPNVAQPAYGGGPRDLVLVSRAHDGTLQRRMYVGGSGGEAMETHHLAVLPDGRLVLSAYTTSANWPGASACATGGVLDMGVVVIRADWSAFDAGVCLGGSGVEWPEGVAVLPDGRVAIGGHTKSAWPSGYLASAYFDPVVTVLSADLARIDLQVRWTAGSGDDRMRVVTAAPDGSLVVGGDTDSTNFYGSSLPATDAWIATVLVPPPGNPPPPDPCVTDPTTILVNWPSDPLVNAVAALDTRGCAITVTR